MGGDREEEKVARAWWHKSIMCTNPSHKRKDHATQSASRIVLDTPQILGVTKSLCLLAGYRFCISVSQKLTGFPNVALTQLKGKRSKRKVDTREYLPTRRSGGVC